MQNSFLDVAEARARLLKAMGEHRDNYPGQIEQQFPRLLVKIADLWPSEELVTFLQTLMFTERRDREGFPPEVASELFKLFNLLVSLGFSPRASGTGWTSVDEGGLGQNALYR